VLCCLLCCWWLQDALGDAIMRKDEQREIDGQLYYGERSLRGA